MTIQARNTGLIFDVDASLRGLLTLGWLEADGIRFEPLSTEFLRERDEAVTRIAAKFAGRPAGDIAGVAETRAMFHRLGVDPTKTRPSNEALMRRVLQGKGLPEVLPAVDVCNLASLEHQMPLGLYDRDKLRQHVNVRRGGPREGYPGIRKQHVGLEGRLLLADDDGPFGAPTSDSARTAVTEATANVLVTVYCPAERPGAELMAMLERVADLLARHCGATVQCVRTVQ